MENATQPADMATNTEQESASERSTEVRIVKETPKKRKNVIQENIAQSMVNGLTGLPMENVM